jgi:hypothetical protein
MADQLEAMSLYLLPETQMKMMMRKLAALREKKLQAIFNNN